MVFIRISPLPKNNKFDRGRKLTFKAEVLNTSSYGVMYHMFLSYLEHR